MREFERRGRIKGDEIGEDVSRRTLTSKTLILPDGRRRLVAGGDRLHYAGANGELKDIDLSPRAVRTNWVIDRAPYTLTVSRTSPLAIIDLQNGGGSITLRPKADGGPAHDDDGFSWHSAARKQTMLLRVMPARVMTYTVIEGPQSAFDDGWVVEGAVGSMMMGFDAERNPAEIEEGTFTGRVSVLSDDRTRQRVWSDKPVWPVTVR